MFIRQADAGGVIDAVVVAAEPEVRKGLQRLLELDGDVRVVSSLPRLRGTGRNVPAGSVVVMAPEVRPRLADWEALLGRNGHGVVVLAAVPGWRKYPTSVVQVPMELRGDELRQAVRRQARRFEAEPADGSGGPSPLDDAVPLPGG